MSKTGMRVTKSELADRLRRAERELTSLRRVTHDTFRRLVQDREDELRAEIADAARAAGAKQTLLAVCDSGLLPKELEYEVRSTLAGLGEGVRVLMMGGVRLWPPALPGVVEPLTQEGV